MTLRLFPIPEFKSRFSVKQNPLHRHSKIIEWVDHMLECSHLTRNNWPMVKVTALFASYLHPMCTDLDRYEVLFKTYVQNFIFNEYCADPWDDSGKQNDRELTILRQYYEIFDKLEDRDDDEYISMIGWKAYTLSSYALLSEIWHDYNPVQRIRMTRLWRDYITGCLMEREGCYRISDRKWVSIDEMLNLRLTSSACKTNIQLIEYSDRLYVSDTVWNSQLFQHFISLSSRLVIATNDLYSFEKEFQQKDQQIDNMFNVIALTMYLDDCSVVRAMERTVDRIAHMETEAKFVMTELLADEDMSSDAKQFVKSVDHLIGGNHRISSILDRYHSSLSLL